MFKKNWRVLNSQWSAHLATLLTWWDTYTLSYADRAKFSEAPSQIQWSFHLPVQPNWGEKKRSSKGLNSQLSIWEIGECLFLSQLPKVLWGSNSQPSAQLERLLTLRATRAAVACLCSQGQRGAYVDAFKAVHLSDDGNNKWKAIHFNFFAKCLSTVCLVG